MQFAETYDLLRQSVERVVRGKPEAIRLALCCLLTEGHLLVEDVPGTGKTSLAKAIANVDRRGVATDPVHPRPAADRHHRGDGVRPGDDPVLVP